MRSGARDAGIGEFFKRCKDCHETVGQDTNLRALGYVTEEFRQGTCFRQPPCNTADLDAIAVRAMG